MRNIRNQPRKRSFESLENRQLLAGNVTADATTVPGTLVIVGDNSANVLVLTQVSPGVIKITPAGTKLNGSSSAQKFTVTNGIYIDMGGGSDSLTLKSLTVPGIDETYSAGLAILMGTGNDALVMSQVTVADGYCAIDTGDGSDATAIDRNNFNHSFYIDGGNGNNAIAISRSRIDGQFVILTGSGNDAITLLNDNVNLDDPVLAAVTLPVDPATEIDNVAAVVGNDFQDLAESLADDGSYIDTGAGADAVALNGVNISGLTEIYTDAGNDAVAIVNSTFGDPAITTIDVATVTPDTPSIGTTDFSGLCIETDGGSDAVSIVNTTVYGFLQVDTSGGVDCPTEELCSCIDGGVRTQQTEPSGTDGNDAVVLNNVKVLVSAEAETSSECCQSIETWCENNPNVIPNEISWECCICECLTEESILESGTLLIYTGNQVDAVALNKVTTDAQADIYTTDETSLDGADAVAITNSSFNVNNEVMQCTTLPFVSTGDGLYIETGCGNDAVTIAKVNVVGEAEIQTGAGSDHVAITALVADSIYAELDGGNYDTLAITNSSASEANFYDDGGSWGTLVRAHNNFGNPSSPPTNTPGNGFQYVVG